MDTIKVKAGKDTSEHAEMKSAGVMSLFLMALSTATLVGPQVVDSIPNTSPWHIVGAVILAVAAALLKGYTGGEFTKGRVSTKASEAYNARQAESNRVAMKMPQIEAEAKIKASRAIAAGEE